MSHDHRQGHTKMFSSPSLNVITKSFPSLIGVLCSASDTEAMSEIDVILKLPLCCFCHWCRIFGWSLGFASPCPRLPSRRGIHVITRPLSTTSPAHLSVALTFRWRPASFPGTKKVSWPVPSLAGRGICRVPPRSFRARFPWTHPCTPAPASPDLREEGTLLPWVPSPFPACSHGELLLFF